jgi:hypothetical protein
MKFDQILEKEVVICLTICGRSLKKINTIQMWFKYKHVNASFAR